MALCDSLLDEPDQFIPQSRAIAAHLFDAIGGDRRISPSDLFVCTYRQGGDDATYLALLKMDPEDGFIGRQESVDGGVRFVLEPVSDVLPTGELQKCAFVLPSARREEAGYDLKVLDQQATRHGGRRLVASFFIHDFLRCKVGLEAEDRTRTFVTASHEWIARKRATWPEADVQRFTAGIRQAVQGQTVDAEAVAAALIPDADEPEASGADLRAHGQEDLTVAPDPAERKRLTQYTWFDGDDGLRVRVKSGAIGRGKMLHAQEDRNTNTWTITIRTTRWQEKLRGGTP